MASSTASPTSKQRVLIVSAHPLFRDGIIRLLGDEVEIVGAVTTWQEARDLDPAHRPQVIIVDHDDAELKETDLAPLLWPDAEDLRVIYVTLAGDKMTVHDRRQVIGASEADLLRALQAVRQPGEGESASGSRRRGAAVSSAHGKPTATAQADQAIDVEAATTHGAGTIQSQGRTNRMDKSQNRRHLIIVSVLVAIVSVAVAVLLLNMQMFQPAASTQAGPIDSLMNAMLAVIAVLFALIVVFMVYSVIVFRRKPGDDGDGAHIHGNTRLEIVWTVLPLITVLIFGTLGARGLAEVTAAQPDELEIDVTALRYAWQFDYPDAGIENATEMVVPVNQPLLLKITSIDVIHDFWVPEFRVKQDAVPGLIRELRITPDKIGDYKVRCDELCGILHHAMLADVRVVSQEDFEAWTAEQVATAEAGPQLSEVAQRGQELSVSSGCIACHNVTGEAGGIGPSWQGLFGTERQFADGGSAVADEDYLYSSIVNPNGQVVSGYAPGVMPQIYGDQLTDEQINDIIQYIKALGAE